jgi:hypothetical protein
MLGPITPPLDRDRHPVPLAEDQIICNAFPGLWDHHLYVPGRFEEAACSNSKQKSEKTTEHNETTNMRAVYGLTRLPHSRQLLGEYMYSSVPLLRRLCPWRYTQMVEM